jgi:hypothetical protein
VTFLSALALLLALAGATSAHADLDLVATATGTQDGAVHVPAGSWGAFAIAVGAIPGMIPVAHGVFLRGAPATGLICVTNPSTAECLSPPAASVVTYLNAQVVTFSVFIPYTAPIACGGNVGVVEVMMQGLFGPPFTVAYVPVVFDP